MHEDVDGFSVSTGGVIALCMVVIAIVVGLAVTTLDMNHSLRDSFSACVAAGQSAGECSRAVYGADR